MHAVVVKATVHDFEKGQKVLNEQVVPRVKQAPGLVAGYWTRSDNQGLSMIVFESEEAARAAAEQARTNAPPSEVVTLDDIEVREVVASA